MTVIHYISSFNKKTFYSEPNSDILLLPHNTMSAMRSSMRVCNKKRLHCSISLLVTIVVVIFAVKRLLPRHFMSLKSAKTTTTISEIKPHIQPKKRFNLPSQYITFIQEMSSTNITLSDTNVFPRQTEIKEQDIKSNKIDSIPNEYIFSFYDANDQARFIKIAEDKNCTVLGSINFKHSVRIQATSEQIAELLKEAPMPTDSDNNVVVVLPNPPKDSVRKPVGIYQEFGNMTAELLGITEIRPEWGKGVTIAILDSGILPHPALADERIVHIDLTGKKTESGTEYSGHGTAVASLIAGNDNSVRGIAPAVSILDIKVLGSDGKGDVFTLAQGIIEAVEQGASIINICLGTQGNSYLLKSAIEYAVSKGVALVASAGNDGTDYVRYPARYKGVIAVAGVDANGRHMFFSNRGTEICIAGPAWGVNSAWHGKSQLAKFSGTSASAPFVSGAIAILLSINSKMTPAEATKIILETSNDTEVPGLDMETGRGVINIRRALLYNNQGIYDVGISAISPVILTENDATLRICVQNRGTEDVRSIKVTVKNNNIENNGFIFNLVPTQTGCCEVKVNFLSNNSKQAFTIICSAEPEGVQDNFMDDNIRAITFLPNMQDSKNNINAEF